MMQPGRPVSHLRRRRFLQLGGSAASAALLYPLTSRLRASAQAPGLPPPRRVLIEDLTLGPADFHLDDAAPGSPGAANGAPAASALISGTLQSSMAFTHVGIHWSSGLPDGSLSLEVRSWTRAVGWSGWEPVSIEASGSDTPSGETFGALVAADRASKLQLRVASDAVNGRGAFTQITVTLLNAVDGPTINAAASPVATVGGLTVVTREGWGADESRRFVGGVTSDPAAEIWPRMYVPTKKVFVHHTATSNSYVDGAAEVRAIYTYHAVTLGWGDIGYNSLIDRDGQVYEGRHGRGAAGTSEILSADVVAGHALSHNYGTTGVALIGTHTARGEGGKPGVAPTGPSWAALVDVVGFECARRGIDPLASGDFLRSDDGWTRALANVAGHRDCDATICPGGEVYSRLGELRDLVAAQLANPGPRVTGLTGPAADPIADGTAEYGWTDGGAIYEHYLEGWRRLPNSEDVTYLRLSDYDPDVGPAWQAGPPPLTYSGLDDGHYTLHVRADDGSGAGYEATHTMRVENGAAPPPPVNVAPIVTVTAPVDGDAVESGAVVEFVGSATDHEDGDLTADLAWLSNLDGALGSGGSFARPLSDGQHTILASVTDSGGIETSVTIELTVGSTGGKGWGKGGKPR